MAVQFSYLQQNADGSVSTQGATADRPPTWGELADHVASTGATLLPATPAAQPPPATREAAAPPPAEAAPLPSRVQPAAGGAPTDYTPPVDPNAPRSIGSYVLPSGAAALGAWGLPVAATAVMGPLGWPATAALATLGAATAGAGGEYGQAQIERQVYGEPPPGAPTPGERALQFGKTAGETEAAVQTLSPVLAPLARAALRPFGSTTVSAASEAGPLLRTGALRGAGGATETAAVEAGQDFARQVARGLEDAHATDSIRVGSAAPTVPINTDPLPPLVSSTRDAIARQGATADQLALFDRNMTPIAQGGPQPLYRVLSAERQLNRWTAAMPQSLEIPELEALRTTTGNTIASGVQGTPAAQPFSIYRDQQALTASLRGALHTAADTSAEAFQPYLAGDGQQALGAMLQLGGPENATRVGQAWLASTRQAARTAANPTQYVADAYNALSPSWRTAMFGEQTPALAKIIGEATSAAPPGLKLPAVGTIQVARPWARATLLSPRAAFATDVLGQGLSGAGRGVLYTGVAQGTEPKPLPGGAP